MEEQRQRAVLVQCDRHFPCGVHRKTRNAYLCTKYFVYSHLIPGPARAVAMSDW